PLGPKPLGDRRQQTLVQLAAPDRDLRPAVAGIAPARLAPHALAVLVVEDELGGEDADLREPFAKAERGELAHRIGLQVDAVTDRLEPGPPIIDAAGRGRPGPGERQPPTR